MNQRTIHLFGLEPIETRYTKEWATHLPAVLSKHFWVCDYQGDVLESSVGTSDFLNWTSTNYFKSSQLMGFALALNAGRVNDGDIVLFTDFWNPAVIQVKYMLGMAGLDVKVAGIAHAGAYDPWDRLAEKLGHNEWVYKAEAGMFECYDRIFFATDFHRDLYAQTHGHSPATFVAGFPMEYIRNEIDESLPFKRNKIVFAQRNAPEKQPHLFHELAAWAKAEGLDYEFVDVGAMGLKKPEYHQHLREAKLVVSFARQETLGITPFEALARGCDILVPDRLSYSEMYSPIFKYPSGNDLERVKERLVDRITNFEPRQNAIEGEYNMLAASYFSSAHMIESLKDL
ncbi:hypothetical protein FDI24_gp124 [Acidovorax phage ACP17]|uniref:Glycosyl transferase family 1 domain-containing protein n=1 Tax=Acidovorax phage ACP17 TaxID=2010329 RepID=A0A218M2Y2_9CAUD|nr:hypothetical protein FDI24_gp124 [Acidovorax phage ACP17]ASD50404.1 hypothetical protein [Acidovorax phage ACP17]